MKFERNEVTTGLLVVVTLGVLLAVVLFLSAPGFFKPLNRYQIFFDNAAGLKPGAPVMVAGTRSGRSRSSKRRCPRPAARPNTPRTRCSSR